MLEGFAKHIYFISLKKSLTNSQELYNAAYHNEMEDYTRTVTTVLRRQFSLFFS